MRTIQTTLRPMPPLGCQRQVTLLHRPAPAYQITAGRAEAYSPGSSSTNSGYFFGHAYSYSSQEFKFTTGAPYLEVAFSYALSAEALFCSTSPVADTKGTADLLISIIWKPDVYHRTYWQHKISLKVDKDNPDLKTLSGDFKELIALDPGYEYSLRFYLDLEANTYDSGDWVLLQGSASNFSVSAVPLPSTALLLGTGLLGLGAIGWRRQRKS
jgi:hypothetical protein